MKVFPKFAAALPKPFALKNDVRIDETPTHVALREAFVNTLVHCDYTVDSNIVVELWKGKCVFSNPGNMLISLSQYYHGGNSVCRNQAIQKMFMFFGKAEKAGSGVDKILKGWKDANFTIPWIEEKMKPDMVVLTLPLVSLLSDDVRSFLRLNFGEKLDKLSHNAILTLATCCTEKEVSNNRLQFILEIHRSDITKLLKELCNDGYLVSKGIGRGTKYTLNIASSGFNVASSDSNVASSDPNVASLDSNVASSDPNVASSIVNMKRRISNGDLFNMIREICADFLTIEEIAFRVNRKSHYIKNHIIQKMLKENIIEREFPNVPNHPRQRYRAIQK